MFVKRFPRPILAAAFAGMFLAGCQPAYDHAAPADPAADLPAAFRADDRGGAQVSGPFWRAFGDPVLDRLEEIAMGANPSLAAARARMAEAAARAGAARAALFPFLNVSGRIGRDRQVSTFGTSTGTSMNLSLAAGYEIDLWKRLSSQTAAGSLGRAAASADLDAARISVAAQVADLYFLIMEKNAQLALNRETIASYEDSLDRVEQRYQAGLVPALDVYQAKQNLLAARAARPLIENALESATNALAVLSGSFPEDFLLRTTASLPEVEKMFRAGLPAGVVRSRPDVRAAWLRLLAADRATAAAVAARFPSFNLLADLGRSRLDFGSVVSGTVYSLAAQMLAPVFDAGRRRAEAAAKKQAALAALAAWHGVILTAFREVDDSLSLIAATGRRLELLQQREETAAETLKLAEDRYYQGLSDYLPVLSAQQQYFAIKSELLAARRQMISANISLARAAGLPAVPAAAGQAAKMTKQPGKSGK